VWPVQGLTQVPRRVFTRGCAVMRETEPVLEGLSAEEFPLLTRLLETDAAPVLREELGRLLARGWLNRSDRFEAGVSARVVGDGFDAACVVENISRTGVLASFSSGATVALDRGGVTLRVRSHEGIRDLAIRFVRVGAVGPGRYEAAFSFQGDDEAAEHLTSLLQVGLAGRSPGSPNR